MKKNKLLTLGIAVVISVGMTTSVFAAPASSTVPVSYDNTKEIGVPIEPDWAIQIPTAIVFTEDTQSVDVGIKLIPKNSTTLPIDLNTTVSVMSTNGYKMKHNDKTEIAYELQYAGMAPLTGTVAVEIATLTNVLTESLGTAKKNGVAKSRGAYVDTLTYLVVKN